MRLYDEGMQIVQTTVKQWPKDVKHDAKKEVHAITAEIRVGCQQQCDVIMLCATYIKPRYCCVEVQS